LAEALREHGDFLIGQGFFRLGEDSPRLIDSMANWGMKGVKFIWPMKNYDDDEYMPVYRRAELYDMVALFHLGIVARDARPDYALDVSVAKMMPIYLDRIARQCPGLTLQGAHLGNPDYHIASELARMHPNIYFDLTGSTLKKKAPEFIGEVFWWAKNEQYGKMGHEISPYQKILFGTDVETEMMEDVLEDHRRVFEALEMSEHDIEMIMGGTAAKLYGLEE
jgi:hypothetical protein